MKKHIVTLTDEQRRTLTSFTRTGTHAARAITHAKILLQADTNGRKHTDEQIAEKLEIEKHTVERARKKFCTQGLDAAIHRKTRKDKGQPVKIDGRVEAQIIKIACSSTPNNEPVWTLRMLADQVVKLEIIESIAHESVRRTLKKTSLNRT